MTANLDPRPCRLCGTARPDNEAAHYGTLCESCWVGKPYGPSSCFQFYFGGGPRVRSNVERLEEVTNNLPPHARRSRGKDNR